MSSQSVIKSPFDRERQYSAKRRAVILSAASAFRRRAKTLGLTKAALYYYVKNKEEILYESHIMAYNSMDDVLKEKCADNQTS